MRQPSGAPPAQPQSASGFCACDLAPRPSRIRRASRGSALAGESDDRSAFVSCEGCRRVCAGHAGGRQAIGGEEQRGKGAASRARRGSRRPTRDDPRSALARITSARRSLRCRRSRRSRFTSTSLSPSRFTQWWNVRNRALPVADTVREMALLNPTIDLVFKLLLVRGQELLRSMLEAVLAEPIDDLSVVDPSIPGELAADKTIVIDVRVVFNGGRRAIVEMQVRANGDLESRLVFYTARDFSDQARRGQHYDSLTSTITIVWLVQPLFPELHQLHSVFELRERSTHQPFSQDLALHVLQLSEISTETPLTRTLAEHRLAFWARFLTARTATERAQLAQEDPIMALATRTLERLSADPDLVRQAEERELSLYFYQSSLARAKHEGLLEGEKKGLLDGKHEGKVETLLLLLSSKFGELPESIQTRLHQSNDAELTRCAGRVLRATSLDDLFDD